MTLIELLVTIVMLGLVAAVVAAAISVIFRSEASVNTAVAESQDTRQGVNYFPLDVESGSYLVREFRAVNGGNGGDRGTGCSDAPGATENILRIDLTDRRIAYRPVLTAGSARLDRYVCVLSSGVWTDESVVNIADSLDRTAPSIASAEVVAKDPSVDISQRQVRSVKLSLAQEGVVRVLTATPRTEAPFAAVGACGSDPLSATSHIDTFVQGDVHLNGTNVKSALAVGGKLSWAGSNPQVASASLSNIPTVPSQSGTYLFADSVNWAASTGSLGVQSSGNVVIRQQDWSSATAGSNWTTFATAAPGGADIKSNAKPTAAAPIDYSAAFVELQACSDLLASLPDGCSGCAAFVDLETSNGKVWPGTASGNNNPTLKIRKDVANVLNMTEQNLIEMAGGQIKLEPQDLKTDWPLVINVATGANVTFQPPDIQAGGNTPIYIIWNFPNATTVNIVGRTMRGTIFAPYAAVTSNQSIEGGVVAKKFTMSGSTLNDVRAFDGRFIW